MSMFCYQCEQTAKGTGCTVKGVCGKEPETASLQDMVIHVAKCLGKCAHRLRQFGIVDREADVFIIEALFSTVTNVNFDDDRLEQIIRDAVPVGERLIKRYAQECEKAGQSPEALCTPECQPADTREGLLKQAEAVRIDKHRNELGDDAVGCADTRRSQR